MVEPGQQVAVHLSVRVAENPAGIFETTDVDVAMRAGIYEPHRDYRPIEFEVGAGEMLPAIDAAVRTMAIGDERTITADPEQAFGHRRPDAIVTVDRSILEKESEVVEQGSPVGTDDGQVGWITVVTDETVTVDFNHEFAGDRVTFELRLLDVTDPADRS